MPKRPVYLDHAATTAVRPEVLEVMLPFLGPDAFGNPSSAHRFGRAARAGIEAAKRTIAEALAAEPNQVIFTSGGTEADNLAVVGAALASRDAGCRDAGVCFHSDAVQAFGKIPVSVREVGCNFLTISGHKIGAPKGIGALVVRDRRAVEAIIHGGGQQFGIRPGTENVPGIVGLGRAVELAAAEQAEFAHRVAALRDELERRLLATVPDAVINAWQALRAPHVTNVAIPGTDSEALLMHFDLAGIACSSGSACSTGAVEPSHVLTAMGVPRELGVAALRFSFGKDNVIEDVEAVIAAVPKIVDKVRALSAVLHR